MSNHSTTAGTATKAKHNQPASAESLIDTATGKLDAAKDAVVEAKDNVIKQGGEYIASARKLITDNPFMAVGIAFGVGYVAMRIRRLF